MLWTIQRQYLFTACGWANCFDGYEFLTSLIPGATEDHQDISGLSQAHIP